MATNVVQLLKNWENQPFQKRVAFYIQERIQLYHTKPEYTISSQKRSFEHDRYATKQEYQIAARVAIDIYASYILQQRSYEVQQALEQNRFNQNSGFFQLQFRYAQQKAKQKAQQRRKWQKVSQNIRNLIYNAQGDLQLVVHLARQLNIQKLDQIQGLPSYIYLLSNRFARRNVCRGQQAKRIESVRTTRAKYLKKLISLPNAIAMGNVFKPNDSPTQRDQIIMRVVGLFFPFITQKIFHVYSSLYFAPSLNLEATNQHTLPICATHAVAKVLQATLKRLKYPSYQNSIITEIQNIITQRCAHRAILQQPNQVFRILNAVLTHMGDTYRMRLRRQKITSSRQFDVRWICVSQKRSVRTRSYFSNTHTLKLLKLGYPLIGVIETSQSEWSIIQACMRTNTIVMSNFVQAPTNNRQSNRSCHAVVIAGYDQSWDVIYILNSWGTEIGALGFHAFESNFKFREIYHLYDYPTERDHQQNRDNDYQAMIHQQEEQLDRQDQQTRQQIHQEKERRSSSGMKANTSRSSISTSRSSSN